MPRQTFPLAAVAGLFLARQHLTRPRTRPLTPARLTRFVEDVGGLQMDSINVLERAHYLTVWSRFGAYDRARLDRLVYHHRHFVEYWAHAACLVPVSALPWWKRAMLDYRLRHTGWSGLRRNGKLLASVTRALRSGGPMGHAEIEGRRTRRGQAGWWNWRPVQYALHYLWMTGVVTIHSRQHFQKRFDLMERAVPAVPDLAAVSAEAFQCWHVERSLHAMGAATDTDLTRYLTYPRTGPTLRRAALRSLLDLGQVTEIEVEGTTGRWLVLTRDLPALARAARRSGVAVGTTLLSPFDSLLWYRERVSRLFGFDYRIEVYTPGHRRVHGYYTLPILHDGRLIGRVDAKSHRAERWLEVRHVHFEPGVTGRRGPDQDAVMAGLADALGSLATFVGAERVSVARTTPGRLQAPLARAVRYGLSGSSASTAIPRRPVAEAGSKVSVPASTVTVPRSGSVSVAASSATETS